MEARYIFFAFVNELLITYNLDKLRLQVLQVYPGKWHRSLGWSLCCFFFDRNFIPIFHLFLYILSTKYCVVGYGEFKTLLDDEACLLSSFLGPVRAVRTLLPRSYIAYKMVSCPYFLIGRSFWLFCHVLSPSAFFIHPRLLSHI